MSETLDPRRMELFADGDLRAFLRESLLIESIHRDPTQEEIDATRRFLGTFCMRRFHMTNEIETAALHHVEVALESARSCIMGETPEVGSEADARDWTLDMIRDALLEHLPAVRAAYRELQTINRENAKAKMALYRILDMKPEGWGKKGIYHAQNVAREGVGMS